MSRIALFSLALLAACGDVEQGNPDTDNEVITTVILTFTPADGGDPGVFRWSDPEDDGDPVIDEVVLTLDQDYALTVRFLDELEDPSEELTEEIADESDQHQVFFTGSAVEGPATGDNPAALFVQAYTDADDGGLPVGLDNDITDVVAGSGELVVTLRHLPPESGEDVKVAGLAETVASDGFSAIGGDDDARVTFPVRVDAE